MIARPSWKTVSAILPASEGLHRRRYGSAPRGAAGRRRVCQSFQIEHGPPARRADLDGVATAEAHRPPGVGAIEELEPPPTAGRAIGPLRIREGSLPRTAPTRRRSWSVAPHAGSNAPTSNRIAAAASRHATTPAAGPRTPAVSQVGSSPGPGGSGKMHRRQAVAGGRMGMHTPFRADARAVDPGNPVLHRDVVDRKRVSTLSVPSRIRSTGRAVSPVFSPASSSTFPEYDVRDDGIDFDGRVYPPEPRRGRDGFRLTAAGVLLVVEDLPLEVGPFDDVRSTSRIHPTPARASWSASTLPSAPHPTTSTGAAASRACPAGPICGRSIWRW